MVKRPPLPASWKDKQQVCGYASDVCLFTNKTQLVVKYDGSPTYSVVAEHRRALWDRPDVTVVYRVFIKEDN